MQQTFGQRFITERDLAAHDGWSRFEARDGDSGELVVLDVFTPGSGRDVDAADQQFKRIVGALGAIDHGHVQPVIAAGFDHGRYFVAAEYSDSPTLAALDRTDELADADLVELALDLADALCAAHDVGVVHGALSGDAVLVAAERGAQVIGFGRRQIAEGLRRGQPTPVDPSADLRAVGAILAECDPDGDRAPELEGVIARLVSDDEPYRSAAALRAHLADLAPTGVDALLPTPAPPGAIRSLPAVGKVALFASAAVVVAGIGWYLAGVLGFRFGDAPATTVPEVAGATEVVARQRLADAALDARIQVQQSAEVPEGRVILQDPLAGVMLDEGDAVTVVVSTGGPPVTIPEVIGRTEPEATRILQGEGFEVTVEIGPRSGFDPGSVYDQRPGGGNDAEIGDRITISVAS